MWTAGCPPCDRELSVMSEAVRNSPIDFDPFDPAHQADPYPYYRRLREDAPVYLSPQGHWILTRHRDCSAVVRDRRFGHGAKSGLIGKNNFRRPVKGRTLPLILLDPPEHTRMRSLVSKAFTPRMVERLTGTIQRLADEMLDAAIEQGEVDLISALAYPLPANVISQMLGVPPEDCDSIKDLSHIVARAVDPDFALTDEEKRERDQAFAQFDEYFRELIRQRQRQPQEDLLSDLVAAREHGSVLSDDELLSTCILLYVAGHETTMDLIGNGTLALLRHPDQARRLREDPGIAESAVEELLRYDPPTQITRRTVLEDLELDGNQISRGEQVVMVRGAANRDPEVFDDPDRLDLGREHNPHLAFDGGIHFCLGAPLARLEGKIVLGTLVRRAPGMELATDRLTYRKNLVIRGLSALPVRLR
jgi:cytochrome P450